MKKVITWLLLCVMLVGLIPLAAVEADATFIWIKDRDSVDGADYTRSTAMAKALNDIFDGNANIYYDRSCTKPVDVTIGTSNVKNDGVMKYVGAKGGPAQNIGTSCWIYANGVYYTLFGDAPGDGRAGKNSVRLDLSGTATRKATYENFEAWGVRNGVGTLIRSTSHSMIILGYDSKTLTVLDGNGDGRGLVSIRTESWDRINYTMQYIIQPKAEYYYEKYPTCRHEYNAVGICNLCQEEYDFASSYKTNEGGYYTVNKETGIQLRIEKPYQEADLSATPIEAGTRLEILGTVTNAFGEIWCKVRQEESTGYIDLESLSFVEYFPQTITGTVTSPEEGQELPQKAHPVSGMVESYYPLQEVKAYLDGECFAQIELGKATSLNLQNSAVNDQLSFSTLSAGTHTLQILARDIHSEEFVTVCVTNFITLCTHTYKSEVTTPATCTEEGMELITCTKCGDCYTQQIPATGHSHQAEVTEPTCLLGGYTTYVCRCGDRYISDETQALGHTWTEEEPKICAVCGVTEGEPVVHIHVLIKVDEISATCTTDGRSAYYTCQCGQQFLDAEASRELTDPDSLLIPFTGHAPDGQWQHSDTHHWMMCATCEQSIEETKATHIGNPCDTCSFQSGKIYGDADGNGMVNAKDAMLVLQYYTKKITEDKLDLSACDVDGNTAYNAKDAMLILQRYTKKIDRFPVEENAPETEVKLLIETPQYSIVWVDEPFQLDYTYTGSGTLTFTSENEEILTVTDAGMVMGLCEDNCTVTVTDGTLTATVTLVVKSSG